MSIFRKAIRHSFKKLYSSVPFKKQLFLLMKMVWLPPQHIYQHLYFHETFTIKVSEKQSFKMDHFGQQIENELFWKGLDGGWEKRSIQLWKALCVDAKVIVDVGANSGLYSLVAKTISPQAEVYSFEPVNRVFNRLLKNNIINDFNIHTEEIALSNYDGEGIVYDTFDSHILSVTVNKNLHSPNITSHPVTISVKKLSTYCIECKMAGIDLIKLDVETHEPEVLEGMDELLIKFKPTLLIEVLNDEVAARIQALVHNLNYLYFDIDENAGISQVNEIKKSTGFNYLLCRESVAQKLKLINT